MAAIGQSHILFYETIGQLENTSPTVQYTNNTFEVESTSNFNLTIIMVIKVSDIPKFRLECITDMELNPSEI